MATARTAVHFSGHRGRKSTYLVTRPGLLAFLLYSAPARSPTAPAGVVDLDEPEHNLHGRAWPNDRLVVAPCVCRGSVCTTF